MLSVFQHLDDAIVSLGGLPVVQFWMVVDLADPMLKSLELCKVDCCAWQIVGCEREGVDHLKMLQVIRAILKQRLVDLPHVELLQVGTSGDQNFEQQVGLFSSVESDSQLSDAVVWRQADDVRVGDERFHDHRSLVGYNELTHEFKVFEDHLQRSNANVVLVFRVVAQTELNPAVGDSRVHESELFQRILLSLEEFYEVI